MDSTAPTGRASTLRRLGWLVVLGIFPAILFALFVVHVPRATYAWDFHAFWHGAREVAHGGNPYASAGVNSAGRPIPAYVYPPLLAELLVPLGLMPFMAAAVIFIAAWSVLALVAALWLLDVRDWRCYGAVFLWFPTLHAFRLGALTPMLVLGVALCWRLRSSAWEPLVVAITVLLKLFLWPLLFWRLPRAGLRSTVQGLAVTIGLAAASWAVVGFRGLAGYPRLLRHAQDQWAPDGYGIATIVHASGVPNAAANGVLLAAAMLLTGVVLKSIRAGRVEQLRGVCGARHRRRGPFAGGVAPLHAAAGGPTCASAEILRASLVDSAPSLGDSVRGVVRRCMADRMGSWRSR